MLRRGVCRCLGGEKGNYEKGFQIVIFRYFMEVAVKGLAKKRARVPLALLKQGRKLKK